MIADLLTMVWKGWKDLFLYRGGVLSTLVVLGVFGILQPWEGGPEYLDGPFMPVILIWLPLFMVATMTADSFAGERERHTLETLLASRLSDRAILFGKIAALVSYGWGLVLANMLLALLTINLVHGHGRWLMIPANTLVVIIAMSLLASLLAATGGVLISLRAATVRRAQQTLTVALLVLIFGMVYGGRSLPAEWKSALAALFAGSNLVKAELIAGAILVVVDAGLLAAAMARFQRARLILD
jgi:ABC-2 type transport system permease protein